MRDVFDLNQNYVKFNVRALKKRLLMRTTCKNRILGVFWYVFGVLKLSFTDFRTKYAMFLRYFHIFSENTKKIAKIKLTEIFISVKNIYLCMCSYVLLSPNHVQWWNTLCFNIWQVFRTKGFIMSVLYAIFFCAKFSRKVNRLWKPLCVYSFTTMSHKNIVDYMK